MPQTAHSLHLFTRFGGFEPSTGVHYPDPAMITADLALNLSIALRALIPTTVTVSRWEHQDEKGTVIDGGNLGSPGTWLADFVDFRYALHLSFASAGPKGKSGQFIHPLPSNAKNSVAWLPQYQTAIQDYQAQLIDGNACDSEGFALTDILRFSASRRSKVRIAP